MDASYIPIAEARGFTTHWIRKNYKDAFLRPFLLKKLEKNIDFYTPLEYDTIDKGTG